MGEVVVLARSAEYWVVAAAAFHAVVGEFAVAFKAGVGEIVEILCQLGFGGSGFHRNLLYSIIAGALIKIQFYEQRIVKC